MHSDHTTATSPMADIQGRSDARRIAIDKVGVKGVSYPITWQCALSGKTQHTVASFNFYVGLPHHQKGTHMSRFMEVLHRHHEDLGVDQIIALGRDMRTCLDADEAYLEIRFPYFIDKRAPVSKAQGLLNIEVSIEASCGQDVAQDVLVMALRVPAMSLCPCSKEISDYSAHSQRCQIDLAVRFVPGKQMSIEQLFDVAEAAASSPVYPVLKRPDEKQVTEAAYDNPKFVEDIVRDLATKLDQHAELAWYRVSSENFESIHNHNAYALVERDKQHR
jgi:GTP cyclohydrolase I